MRCEKATMPTYISSRKPRTRPQHAHHGLTAIACVCLKQDLVIVHQSPRNGILPAPVNGYFPVIKRPRRAILRNEFVALTYKLKRF